MLKCDGLFDGLFNSQIQVRNPKFTGVGATLIEIGKKEGFRGYFKVGNDFICFSLMASWNVRRDRNCGAGWMPIQHRRQ